MSDLVEKIFLPIATGAFGYIIRWLIELNRTRYRRDKILAALHAHLDSIPRICQHNKTATNPSDIPRHLLPMLFPIIPFETAIFSENGVNVKDETVKLTTDYLIKARELNSSIQAVQNSFFNSAFDKTIGSRQLTLKFIYDQTNENMPIIAENLKEQIEKEQNWFIRLKRYINSKNIIMCAKSIIGFAFTI